MTATAIRPDQGRSDWLSPAFGVVQKLNGDQTGGISIVEHPFGPRAMVPPHRHTLEDEISYVLEGELGFRSGNQEVLLTAGSYIVKPRNELHAMWNPTDRPARMMEIIAPGGFERYFIELVDLLAANATSPVAVERLRARYGLSFDSTWVPDLVARYGLTPPRS